MSFNYDKCKVIHFGKKNREQTNTMSLGQDKQPHVHEKSESHKLKMLLKPPKL
jgi:hypothetical protein